MVLEKAAAWAAFVARKGALDLPGIARACGYLYARSVDSLENLSRH